MLYNLSEFMTMIKEDIGIKDVPLPVDDGKLIERFDKSALREFSVRYPYITEIPITSQEAINYATRNFNGAVDYIIPEKYYQGTQILDILGLNPGGFGSEANMYMPNVVLGSADMLIESIADIKLAASIGSMMSHSPTHYFQPPNKLRIYNGWNSASYRVEIALKHDLSLSTIPQGALTNLRELAALDLKWYLFKKLNRMTELDTGVGQISLKIDSWESAESEFRDLLRQWDESGSLDTDRINYF